MTTFPTPSPDQSPSPNDPGDETARRYRFQWTWAAIVCCTLFDDTHDVVEVFCEQHEDVLLKHHDGTFTGQQVKTRASDQPIWKAGDEPVISACARFVQLDAEFPARFREFRFLTSHPLHAAENAKCLSFVLLKIKDTTTIADLPAPIASWLRKVAKTASQSELVAFQALKKATASDELPKLQDSSMRLIQALTGCWPGAADCSHDSVRRASHALIDECSKASSLDHEQTLPAYLAAASQADDEAVAARITGKRMTKNRVREVLERGLNSTAVLVGDPATHAEPGQGSTELLRKKLDAGGFSAVSCNSAEDLRDKADYLGIAWTKQQGRVRGLERYEHVRSVALSDAARAFEATKSEGQQFGPAMRESLRQRFRERRAQNEQLFDCSDEHLEGFAYSLTAQCKVQWSINRPWEEM